ncbi:MAG: hypothetical protein JSW11_17815 [Candidatus Heimdallarchaeota archaeon]|nr:MAG: hypothetical protein JSW11_17815 [Candidatus Heimdallarchaeota archaeon]
MDSESLQDLLRGRAIAIDTLTSEFSCSQLELPQMIKNAIGDSIRGRNLVMKTGLFLMENCPPNKTNCQICIREFEGETYFQCEDCRRHVCTPHYVDLKTVGSTNCPNCGGTLMSFPFSCEGYGLDFSNVIELPQETTRCPLCSYSLPSQTDLIEGRTSAITFSTRIEPSGVDFESEKKGK